MLTHPTLDLLHHLGLHGMAKGFKDLGRGARWIRQSSRHRHTWTDSGSSRHEPGF